MIHEGNESLGRFLPHFSLFTTPAQREWIK